MQVLCFDCLVEVVLPAEMKPVEVLSLLLYALT
jgi:hypothetical protein